MLINVSEVEKSYGDFKLEASLSVDEGEIVGLVGPNGAGKSTLMQLMTGQERPDSGKVEVLGLDPSEKPRELREEIGILPEREDPPSFLTGDEYLQYVSDVRGEEVDDEMLEMLGLSEEKMGRETRSLSKGERQKLMVIQAFFHDPELVFIDEPLINLDPITQDRVKQIFEHHREGDGSMVLATHLVSLAEELCDRVAILENGEIREIVEDPENLREKFRK